MQIETLKDVLHWTSKFHDQLSQCLSHCADKNESDRAKMLLAYLAKHEKELADVVDKFEEMGGTKALNTWIIEYLDKQPIVQHKYLDAPFSELDTQQIMAVIVDQHQQVIELYRYLFSRADIPSTQELLGNLKSFEENEMKLMSQAANRLEDL